MSTFLKLTAYVTEQTRQGVAIGAPSVTVEIGNGTTVEIPVPFVRIGGFLALVPYMSIDGETGVRTDLSLWSPAYISPEVMVIFPANFDGQADAVHAARAFDADPNTSWNDSRDQMTAWLREWAPANGVRL